MILASIAVWLADIGAGLLQILFAFYGFWLIWRVMLPWLPGPEQAEDRIAPYARYFTDPIVAPLAKTLHISQRGVATVLLIVLATAGAYIGHLQQAIRL